MMRKFFILLTLTMFTFVVGHAQFDVKTQPGYDARLEEIYGQPPVSDELPDYLDLSGMMKGNRSLENFKGYGMLIPASGSYNGVFYGISFKEGKVKVDAKKRYTNHYFTAMENVGGEENGTTYVYCNDYTKGFGTLSLTGVFNKISNISKGMTDMTYNHNNSKMYGLRYGEIWEINTSNGAVVGNSPLTSGTSYIAIACSTSGDMYAITQNATAASLVMYKDCDFTKDPICLNANLGLPAQYTQSMTYEHNEDKLIWWQVSNSGKHIVELDPVSGQVVGDPVAVTSSIGGLWVDFVNGPHSVTWEQPTGATVSVEVQGTSGKDGGILSEVLKGKTVLVTVTPENCNTITSVTWTKKDGEPVACDTVNLENHIFSFVMPSKDVTVNVGIQVNPLIESVEITATESTKACYGEGVELTATVTGAHATKYEWYKDEVKQEETTISTYTANSSGEWYVVAYTEFGCVKASYDNSEPGTVTVDVQANEVAKPAFSNSSEDVCYGSDYKLTLSNYAAAEGYTFVWKDGETPIEGANSNSYEFKNITGAKNITVTVYETAYPDCTKISDAFNISVIQLPSFKVAGITNICYHETATLTATVEPEEGETYSYQWYKGTEAISNATESMYTTETLDANTTYCVKVTKNDSGCGKMSDPIEVTVHQDLGTIYILTSAEEEEACEGSEVTFTTLQGEGYTYKWYDNETEIAGENSYQYVMGNATVGEHRITVEATHEGCSKSSEEEAVVVVVARPNVVITNNTVTSRIDTVCAATTVTMSASGADSYTWSCEGIFETKSGASITFEAPRTSKEIEKYYVVAVGTATETGCDNSATLLLTVLPLPSVALVETDDILQVCKDGSATLHVEKPVAGYTYDWFYKKDDESETKDLKTSGTSYKVDFKDIEPLSEDDTLTGYYIVQATDTWGCGQNSVTDTITVALVESPSQPIILGPTSDICYGDKAVLKVQEDFNLEDYYFYWYQNVNGEWVIKDTTTVKNVLEDPEEYYYTTDDLTEDTEFKLAIRYIDSQETGGCVTNLDEAEKFTVHVKKNINVKIDGFYEGETDKLSSNDKGFNVCVNNPYYLVAADGYQTYQWFIDSIGKGEYEELENATDKTYNQTEEEISQKAKYGYKVVVKDEDGCEFYGCATVNIYEEPTISFVKGADQAIDEEGDEICVDVETSYTANVTETAEGEFTYKWSWTAEPEKPITVSGGDEKTVTIIGLHEATLTMTVEVTNSTTTCTAMNQFDIKINPLPVLEISSPKNDSTYNMIEGNIAVTATINGETTAGGTFYLNDVEFSGETIDPTTMNPGVYTLKYTYTDENSCYNEAVSEFTIIKPYWDDEDVRRGDWYEIGAASGQYEIPDAESYGYFVYLLNEGVDDFEGKYIRLVNNIDLAGKYVRPHTGLKGIFDGYGKIMSNMTICDTIGGTIQNNGTIRNLGIKDAKVTAISDKESVNFVNNGNILNSFFTGTRFTFSGTKDFSINNAEGARIENFYLANDTVYDIATLTVNSEGTMKSVYSKPAVNFSDVKIPDYGDDTELLKKLNDCIDDFNSSEFWGWRVDDNPDTPETDPMNYGHPVFDFIPYEVHYIVDLLHVEGGEGNLERSHIEEYEEGFYDRIKVQGKEKGHGKSTAWFGAIDTTMFAFPYDTVTVTVTPDDYMRFDSLSVWTAGGVHVEPYLATPVGETEQYYFFCMPANDSIRIDANISKDYWTDSHYAEFGWYEAGVTIGSYSISDAKGLAGLARIVNNINLPDGITQSNFEDQIINLANNIDLSGHVWKPIEGFKGTLEGYGKYIEKMYTVDDKAALFAKLENGAVVRNLGIRNAEVETTGEPATSNVNEPIYTESFKNPDSGTGLPSGWSSEYDANYSNLYVMSGSDHIQSFEGDYIFAYMNGGNLNGSSYDFQDTASVTSNAIDLNGKSNVILKFHYATGKANDDTFSLFDQPKIDLRIFGLEESNKGGSFKLIESTTLDVTKEFSMTDPALGSISKSDYTVATISIPNTMCHDSFKVRFEFAETGKNMGYWGIVIDDIQIIESESGNGGAAIAVNNAGSVINCYVTSSSIEGAVTGVAVANNMVGGQVKNVYGGMLTSVGTTSYASTFIADNKGTAKSNFAEFTTEETYVEQFTDRTELTKDLNTFVDVNNETSITAAPLYYRWENVAGENSDYPVFSTEPYFYITATASENGSVTTSPTFAKADESITVYPVANPGYELDTLSYSYYSDGEMIVTDIKDESSFLMPNANTSVYAGFEKKDLDIAYWNCAYDPDGFPSEEDETYGSITGQNKAKVGETVNIAVTPKDDCEIQIIVVAYIDEEGESVPDTIYYKPDDGANIPTFFVMPAYDVTVYGGFNLIQYTVSDTLSVNGKVVPNPAMAFKDTNISFTITPNDGYEYKDSTFKCTDENSNPIEHTIVGVNGSFIMPGSNVGLQAEFTAINYDITAAEATNGSISFKKGEAATTTGNVNDEITVENAPATDYELVSLYYDYTKGEEAKHDTIAEGTFTMPAADVTVTPAFDGKYFNIAIAETEHGSVTTDAVVVSEGNYKQRYTHKVTMTFSPESGYTLDHVYVEDASGKEYKKDVTSFDMPNYDVTIRATFREAYWSDLGIRSTKWYTENTGANEFYISDGHDLGGLSYLVNGFVENGVDTLVSFYGKTIYLSNNIDLAQYKWRPIGGMVLNDQSFKGTFNGLEHEITNMSACDSLGSYMALFGVNNGVIANVEVGGSSIGKYWTAGIAGKNYGTIRNCASSVSIMTWFEAGGIAAHNYGTIENCYNSGYILNRQANHKATMWVGGIAANNTSAGFIKNCYNSGTCEGNGNSPVSYFGGIVGKNVTKNNVTDSYWVYEPKTGTAVKYGEKKGVGTGYIANSCVSYTRAEAALVTGEENCLLDKLNIYVDSQSSGLLRTWSNGPTDYKYPVFGIEYKGEEITDIDENVTSDINFNLYPNPAKDYVRIECEGITRITVVNMLGQVVINQNYDTDNVMLYVNDMTPGVYTVNVVTVNGNFTKNLVVTR